MGFEKFVPPRKAKLPQVSIKKTGTITFSNEHAREYGFDRATHAVLFFDPAKRLIGVKPVKDTKDSGAIKLTHRQRVTSLRARTFFEVYGITLDRTRKYPLRFDAGHEMAVIDVRDAKRRRGPRKRIL